ncbi:SCO family protein [Methylobacterium tarhaniae]|nr:SCO family protein [Methylobacterium tarhaniae]
MWTGVKYMAALAIGLPLWGIPSAVSVEPQANPAAPSRNDLDTLLWPSVDAARRIDQRGRALRPADLRDRVAVVAFVTAECSIACVTRILDLDRVAKALPQALRDRAVFLAVSLDDAKGGNATLRAFADGTAGAGTRLRFLAGDAAWTASLMALLRYPAARMPEPPPQVLVFDRRGGIAMTYGGDPVDRPRLERDIPLLDTFAQGLGAAPAPASPQPR